MKNIIKSLLAITAVASIGTASAETIYMSGSTAFRKSANAALKAYCDSRGGGIVASNNTDNTKMDRYVGSFTNSDGTHFVSVAWSGSEGGIQSAAGPRVGQDGAINNTFWAANATGTNSESNTVSVPADACFSDTYQATSMFSGDNGYTPLTGFDGGDGIAGVVTFCWAVSTNCPITNMTAMGAQNLIPAGKMPVTIFNGNLADTNKSVFLIGRNSDSGTRLAAFGECGYGANFAPQQYKYNSTTNIEIFPGEDINGLTAGPGNSGYSSGSSVAAFMTNNLADGANLKVDGVSSTSVSNYLIGYVGLGDVNARMRKLTYNGVESTSNNIINGSYSFWTYIHFYYNPDASALTAGLVESVGNTLAATRTADLNPSVGLLDMKAGRNGDALSIYKRGY